MLRLILSDLHLGNPLFKHENELLNLLDCDFDEIIFCGDILDVWELPIDKIISKYSNMISFINMKSNITKIIIIHGNHDPDIPKLKNIFSECHICESYEYDNNIVVHGDEFDEFILKYSSLSRWLSYFNWIFERFGLDLKTFFRELFYSISAKRQKVYYNDLVSDIEKAAVDKYSESFSTVIMGHTHMPKIVGSKCLYVNVGDMIHNYTYVLHDGVKFRLFNLRR